MNRKLRFSIHTFPQQHPMIFLGIDLAWHSHPSGLCCLHWQDGGLHLKDLTRLSEMPQILAWIDHHLPARVPGGIAVDAPTIITNPTGMRLCDRLAHRHFGRYDAGCYPANLGLPFAERLLAFSANLETRGFAHAPSLEPQTPTRFQIEVFPHPATVRLFRLPRILKYKKGRVGDRRIALAQFRQYILDVLPQADPPLPLTDADLPPVLTTGPALKHLEDQLDSLICAYVAAHWWQWGHARNQVLGDRASGFIVVPNPDGVD